MTIKDFANALTVSLIKRGISEADAVNHVKTVTRTVTEEDLREITEYNGAEDFEELSDSLAEMIKEKKRRFEQKRVGENNKTEKDGFSDKVFAEYADDISTHAYPFIVPQTENFKEMEFSETKQADAVHAEEVFLEDGEILLGDDSKVKEKLTLSTRGKAKFATLCILTLPVSLAAALIICGLFVFSVSVIGAIIAVSICVVLALAAASIGLLLVGTIYGTVEIVGGLTGTGIYEIGLGIIGAGVFVVLAVLLYSFAVRTMPFIMKELLLFWDFVGRQIGAFVEKVREGCDRP